VLPRTGTAQSQLGIVRATEEALYQPDLELTLLCLLGPLAG
jgi:hypothetical protein